MEGLRTRRTASQQRRCWGAWRGSYRYIRRALSLLEEGARARPAEWTVTKFRELANSLAACFFRGERSCMFSLHASVICVDILKGSPRLRLRRGSSCAPSRWDRRSSWSARPLSFQRSRSSVGSSCGASGAIRSESITLLYTINTEFIVWVVGSDKEREYNSTLHY